MIHVELRHPYTGLELTGFVRDLDGPDINLHVTEMTGHPYMTLVDYKDRGWEVVPVINLPPHPYALFQVGPMIVMRQFHGGWVNVNNGVDVPDKWIHGQIKQNAPYRVIFEGEKN